MASLRVVVEQENSESSSSQWIDKLLDGVSIRSRIPGRIRFHLAFEGDEILADTLRRELQKLDTVHLDSYSVRTGNALVTFAPGLISELQVITALLRGVREFARIHGDCDLEHHHHETRSHAHDHEGHEHEHSDEDDCDHDHSATSTDAGIRKELLKLAVSGGVLGYFVYKKVKGKRIAFYGNPLLDVASLVTIASGYKIFRDGVGTVQKHKKPTDDTLISIAVIATLLMGESITGLSVVWLINLGRLLEAITLKRSRTAIKELMDIAPNEAWLVTGTPGSPSEKVTCVAVEKLQKSQRIRIFHSEKVPLDGKIVSGKALVREAFITGEALPREKTVGETVYAGSLIEQGDIDIEITNLVHDTVVARMVHAIENVRDKKAPIERIGARFASKFVPISIGVSVATLLVTGDLRRAITMLVIACPCAAGLATPTAVSASIGQAARKGILIKGGTHLEMAAKVDAIIFDKTGTLTEGEPKLNKFIETELGKTLGRDHCLQVAASAEQHTTHPLGLVLLKEAQKQGLTIDRIDAYKLHSGLGISARVNHQDVHVGNLRFLKSLAIEVPVEFESQTRTGFVPGESILFLSIDKKLCGAFIVQDRIRPEAIDALRSLKALGVKRVLLATGDQKVSADFVAKSLGIPEVHSELLPADKLDLVRDLKSQGYKVAMVGDGVNDAQALAEADLSIAMGGGHCDIAIETADVTLARNDLLLVPEVLDISQKTLKTIYQNFAAAVGINTGGMLFSASGKLSPFAAALVHNASTIAVVLNSLRLGRQVAGSNPLEILSEVKI